jgi:hypothetical protein
MAMTDGPSLMAWEPIAGEPAAAMSEHRAREQSDADSLSATLFHVVDGEGSFVRISELGSPDAGGAEDARLQTLYREVFRAPDARSFSGISEYLFVVKADIDPPDPEEFEHWYNEVHVPDVGGAGLRRARRFHATGPGARYLATYEIASPEVMTSEPVQKVRGFHQYTDYVKDIQRWILQPAPAEAQSG